MSNISLEAKTLRVGAFINLLMAIGGWVAYSYTSSEALLLDGNFSFIAVLVTVAAEFISRAKHRRTTTFPFGSYAYEAFFVLFKGFLILGVIIAALFQNTIKVIDFIGGAPIQLVQTGVLVYYIVLMASLSFGMSFYAQNQRSKITGGSELLKVEIESLRLDGFLSLFSGGALILFSFIPQGSPLDFLLYTGDALVVLILCLAMIKTPFLIIKDAFIELGGGVLQNKLNRNLIEETVNGLLPEEFIKNECFITKMGSNYLVLVYVSYSNTQIDMNALSHARKSITVALEGKYEAVGVEILFRKDGEEEC